ncbi:uncharacterized protein DUF6270 [Cytobacillus horneckiae]|uniref:DUF6270 domain-containing protein n=1 Tax=Cytobacillus horneckiae TaxID=549687 RepID=UPI0019D00B94|nr:DUF6270 domain-containing protein [Cytobacillus horneckiae]MBN6889892.1 hypothetical protein [Cytobacillus horneckiae]
MSVKVAVMGSCVSRDVFNTQFNRNYKWFYECVATQFQSSVISLMSNPVEYNPEKIDNLEPHPAWTVRTELTKEFLPLIKDKNPDYLLLDFFGDVFFGVIKLGESKYITNNRWKVWKTTFYKEIEDPFTIEVNLQHELFMELWKENIDKFFDFLKKNCPNTQVVLVRNEITDKYKSKAGELKTISNSGTVMKIDTTLYQSYWDKMNEYVVSRYNTKVLDMCEKEYISYEEHPWKQYYVHYTLDFYEDLFNKLQLVFLDDMQCEYEKLKENSLKEKRYINELEKRNKKLIKKINFFNNEPVIHAIKRYLLKVDSINSLNNKLKSRKN